MTIQRIVRIIHIRLPYEFNVKYYKNNVYLIKFIAKEKKWSYQKTRKFYDKYLTMPLKATYINTKYWQTKRDYGSSGAMAIPAVAGEPIAVSLSAIRGFSDELKCFLILHEIGHNVLETWSERKCDLFAIRWIRKFIKEGLVKFKGG